MSESASPDVLTNSEHDDQPDWELAKSLYLQGLALSEICGQANVSYAALRKRASRNGWTQTRDSVRAAVLTKVTTITKSTNQAAVAVAKDSLRPVLHKLAHDIAASEPMRRPTKSLASAETKSRVLNTVTQAVKAIEGWTEASIQTSVTVEGWRLLTDDVILPPHSPKAIDVSSEQVQPADPIGHGESNPSDMPTGASQPE